MSGRPPLSTHILDTSKGCPAAGVDVSLFKCNNGEWTKLNSSVTNSDGRCADLLTTEASPSGRYKLHFEVGKYFAANGQSSFYPFIEIIFDCSEQQSHYHVPLLLSQYGFTTYRGS